MFRTLARRCLPNPLDWICKRARSRKQTKFLLAWNRGLGDIALGLYAIIHRIRFWIPEAEITFLIRGGLQEGFSLLEGVQTISLPDWKRGEKIDVQKTLMQLGREKEFDVIIPNASPTDWVRWQHGKLTPKLAWKKEYDPLWKRFNLSDDFIYIGVQAVAETNYGLWRNWPLARWREWFTLLKEKEQVRVLLFGFGGEPRFDSDQIIDLRGQTTLFELLSLIKERCTALIAPDSGILSMVYYLNESFPLKVVSLWADPAHGILKQAVVSPNPKLIHRPLFGEERDLSTLLPREVFSAVFED